MSNPSLSDHAAALDSTETIQNQMEGSVLRSACHFYLNSTRKFLFSVTSTRNPSTPKIQYDKWLELPFLRMNKQCLNEIMAEDWKSGWFGHLKSGKDMIAFFNSEVGKNTHQAITAGELLYNCMRQAMIKNPKMHEQSLDVLNRASMLPLSRREISQKHVSSFLGVIFYLCESTDGFFTKEQQYQIIDCALSSPSIPNEMTNEVLTALMMKAIRGGDRERIAYIASKGVQMNTEKRRKLLFNLFKGIMRGGKAEDFTWALKVMESLKLDMTNEADLKLVDSCLSASVHMAPPNFKTGSLVTRMRSMENASVIVQFLRSCGILFDDLDAGKSMIKWVVQTLDIREKYLVAQPEAVAMVQELTTMLVGSGAPTSMIPAKLEMQKLAGLHDLSMTLAYGDKQVFQNYCKKSILSSDLILLIFQIAYGPVPLKSCT